MNPFLKTILLVSPIGLIVFFGGVLRHAAGVVLARSPRRRNPMAPTAYRPSRAYFLGSSWACFQLQVELCNNPYKWPYKWATEVINLLIPYL